MSEGEGKRFAGRLRYTDREFGNRLLAYVDNLGWSDLVRARRTRRVLYQLDLGVFNLAATRSTEAARKRIFDRMSLPHGKTIKTGFFSDTFVCSCEPRRAEVYSLVDMVQRFCGALVGNGLYPRGAIVVGDLLHDDNGTIVGQALIDAHLMERCFASYPRVLVSDAAEPLLVRLVGEKPWRYSAPQVRVDRGDGLKFLDIFPTRGPEQLLNYSRERVTRAKAILRQVRARYARKRDLRAPNVREKHQWMADYLNEVDAELAGSTA